jgi:large subunit ribosomal protein L24
MANSRSTQPRKQRKSSFNASPFDRHRQMAVPLSRELRARYKRRALPIRKGDTVRIISGNEDFRGREERVSKVDMRSLRVTLDNITIKKVDQKLKPLPIGASHLILTHLNLTDPWRRKILHVSAAEVPPEETAASEPEATPALPASEEPETPPEMDADAEGPESEEAEDTTAAPAPPARKKRTAKPKAEDSE